MHFDSSAQIRAKLPAGRELPAKFDAFVRAAAAKCVCIEWNDPDPFGFKRTARKQLLPFLKIGDGGLIALWYHADVPAILHIGSEGQREVIAATFDDYLKEINAKFTDDAEYRYADSRYRIPGVKGKPNRGKLAELRTKFDAWFEQYTTFRKPLVKPEAESLRRQACAIVEKILRDERSQTDSQEPSWHSMTLKIERSGDDIAITRRVHGEWRPLPRKYKFSEVARGLLKFVLNKKRKSYEVLVTRHGTLSIEHTRQLILVDAVQQAELQRRREERAARPTPPPPDWLTKLAESNK